MIELHELATVHGIANFIMGMLAGSNWQATSTQIRNLLPLSSAYKRLTVWQIEFIVEILGTDGMAALEKIRNIIYASAP